jgi:CheY-like chemotaxis protein
MLLEVFGEWLQEENCRVTAARDGAAALQILRNRDVDVIVSGVRMPVLDGTLLLNNLTTYSGLSQGKHPPNDEVANGGGLALEGTGRQRVKQ